MGLRAIWNITGLLQIITASMFGFYFIHITELHTYTLYMYTYPPTYVHYF